MQILENHKAPLCSSSSCFKWHKDKRNLVVWLLQYICTHYEQELQEKSYPLNPINTWNSSLDSYFDFSCEENISSKQWFYTDLIFSTFSYLHWASHSMSRVNLKKWSLLDKYHRSIKVHQSRRPRICINWNPAFQAQIYLVIVPLKTSETSFTS